MRVFLVGSTAERERLRAHAHGRFTIVDEFASIGLARASTAIVDAVLVAPTGEPDGPESLTVREVQVLELLAEGLPNKAIAARLGISDQTAKFHVAAISGKLGAVNRTDAVRRAARRGLIAF